MTDGEYVIEVFGAFGGFAPWKWGELRLEKTEQQAKKMASSLTWGHYRAARVRHKGKIVHYSGGRVE